MAYDDLIDDQGLQPDGGSPDPSQQGGEPSPDPSQDKAGEKPEPQQTNDVLPPEDDRGVPATNVLSEMRKKIDQTMEAVRQMSEQFTRYNTPQAGGYQPQSVPQTQTQVQPQQKAKTPTNYEEAAEMLTKEISDKIASGDITEQLQLEAFRNKRFFELNQQVQSFTQNVQNERFTSENRIKDAYPDLNDFQSDLSRAVVNEIMRRNNRTGQDIYKSDPYCLEAVVPYIASQLGIQPKLNGRRIQSKTPSNLPPSLGGRGSNIPQPERFVPTDIEKIMSPRYGNDPVEMAKFNKEHPDSTSISVEGVLES
jgi:hypothetical protein